MLAETKCPLTWGAAVLRENLYLLMTSERENEEVEFLEETACWRRSLLVPSELRFGKCSGCEKEVVEGSFWFATLMWDKEKGELEGPCYWSSMSLHALYSWNADYFLLAFLGWLVVWPSPSAMLQDKLFLGCLWKPNSRQETIKFSTPALLHSWWHQDSG